MPSMSKKKRKEMEFFINDSNRIEHNKVCRACIHDCKQSHKTMVLACSRYKSERSK